MTEQVKEGFLSKIQPWQSLFGLLTAAFTMYGVEDIHALIFYAMIMVCLGFVMVSSNKNKEAMKTVVIPFVIAKALKVLENYTTVEPTPEPLPEPITEPTRDEIKAELREAIEVLEQELEKE
ncbi:unnamed protein product [marine sediment metagenome]|uniref:Uncharacterized protein n=1 Tax=marine sediment metagenome TaxID=412755 RepID=X0UTV3_9ZZZZ